MTDVMIDIETLGVLPGCVILSIGATNGKDNFSVKIDVEDSVKRGLIIEPRTTIWWMGQSEEARKLISEKGVDLESALKSFASSFDWKNSRVWCNGASFDFPILKAAFNAIGKELPWPYYNEMDFRTIKNFFDKRLFQELQVKPTVAHDGLQDARAQLATLDHLLAYMEEYSVKLRAA